jgi:hypothetical protein
MAARASSVQAAIRSRSSTSSWSASTSRPTIALAIDLPIDHPSNGVSAVKPSA